MIPRFEVHHKVDDLDGPARRGDVLLSIPERVTLPSNTPVLSSTTAPYTDGIIRLNLPVLDGPISVTIRPRGHPPYRTVTIAPQAAGTSHALTSLVPADAFS